MIQDLANMDAYYQNIYYDILKRNQPSRLGGRLEVTTSRGKPFVYFVGQKNGVDLPKERLHEPFAPWVTNEAQRKLDNLALPVLSRRHDLFSALIEDLEVNDLQKIYNQLHPGWRSLIQPLEMPPEQWLALPNPGNPFYSEHKRFTTSRGDVTRSKSEKIIADRIYLRPIAYQYEKTLRLGEHTIYPDFTLLDETHHRELYWEHFGLMDQKEYSLNALRRIHLYQSHGLFLGERLIATFEWEGHPLDIAEIDAILDHYFPNSR